MCGIAGIVHFDRERAVSKPLLIEMTNTLKHRGPDGEGYFVEGNVGLGHRRLSIIDLSTGDQPQFNDDKSIALVFNGEIYNYIELREELKRRGYSFTTNSDTEVIIRAYEHWGVKCQEKFNGMWAFALWDKNKDMLFISRDRLGEKPLYYAVHDNSFVFGSEIKSILKYGIPQTPNFELTELYLTLSCVPAPFTFYKGIHKLSPGHNLIVGAKGYIEQKYWDVPDVDDDSMIRDRVKVDAAFKELLYDSVRIRMRSDVAFGAFLSGGLDSSAIVSVMSEISKLPVQTFTIGYKEKFFDERKLAQLVAEKFETDHSEFCIEPGSLGESIRLTLNHFDEPFGDSSAIPTANVSRMAAQRVKMVLTGDGGDEVLSGYTSYQGEKFAGYFHKVPGPIRDHLPGFISRMSQAFRGDLRYRLNRGARVLASSRLPFLERLESKMWCNSKLISQLIPDSNSRISLDDFLRSFFSRVKAQDTFYKLMHFHLKVLLPDDYLTKVDRMSMAYSLETRVPFLDHRIVEFMAQVHKDVKMQGFTRKSVLRRAFVSRLPPALYKAPKKGFGVPLREWFKGSAFQEELTSLQKADIGLNNRVISNLIMENAEGKEDLGNFLWILTIYKNWLEGSGR